MKYKVLDYLKKNNMLSPGDRVVAGVSGGADSMCLLSLLLSWRELLDIELLTVHVNHGIRGAEAERDERFVENFCREHGVEYLCIRGNIPELADKLGLTEEEAGRRFRYEQFFQICHERGFNRIAVAHNRDDNAETILFNMFRGSGISGIRGIAPVRIQNDVTVIRPLLGTSRQEIEQYLEEEHIGFCTDSTNLTQDYSRNRIRNTVLPIVRDSINSQAAAHIAALGEQAGRIEDYLNGVTDKEMASMETLGFLVRDIADDGAAVSVSVDAGHLMELHEVVRTIIIRRLLGELAHSMKDIENRHVEAVAEIASGGTGRSADLPYGLKASKEYSSLIIRCSDSSEAKLESISCAVPGEYGLTGGKKLRLYSFTCEKKPEIPKNNYTKYYDYDKIKGSIVLRTRADGDYLVIADGIGGVHKKTLKTWFIDNKVGRSERESMPLLAENSHILWVVGCRGDDAYPVTDDTRRILVAELVCE